MKPRLPVTPVFVAEPDTHKAAWLADLGCLPYGGVHALQLRLVEARRAGRLAADVFLVVEHFPVYTVGRRGGREQLLAGDTFLAAQNIEVVPIERGGEITYHGPGQLVIYPILDLRGAHLGVAEYIHRLESLMIEIARGHGIDAGRDPRNHGIWASGHKLGSIGVAIRHGIAFHGMALNINNDLTPFSWIHPCGLVGVVMTSLSVEAGCEIAMARVKEQLGSLLGKVFDLNFTPVTLHELGLEEFDNDHSRPETGRQAALAAPQPARRP